MRQNPADGGGYQEFHYTSNPLSTTEFIDCMFKGPGDERMRWIGEDPANYRTGATRRGADVYAGVFRVSKILDPGFSGGDKRY
jgi:hypothetical protein